MNVNVSVAKSFQIRGLTVTIKSKVINNNPSENGNIEDVIKETVNKGMDKIIKDVKALSEGKTFSEDIQNRDFEYIFGGDVNTKVKDDERYMPYKDVMEMCKQREWEGIQISEVTIDWKVVQKGKGIRSIEEAQQLMKEKKPDTVVKVFPKGLGKKGTLMSENTTLPDSSKIGIKNDLAEKRWRWHSRLVIVN